MPWARLTVRTLPNKRAIAGVESSGGVIDFDMDKDLAKFVGERRIPALSK
jgi:hypothetical protein